MFTGIVEACTALRWAEPRGSGMRLCLPAPDAGWQVAVGESVAVSGACLTVAELLDPGSGAPLGGASPGADMLFELSAETLDRTWFRDLKAGTRLNLERALRLSDRLGGHLVSGHVDGLGRVVSAEERGDGGRELRFELAPGLERYLIEKGSITLDGVSLTVVAPRGRSFAVALIPLTLERTSLGTARIGQAVNVEADLVGKWIERLLPG
jgi:riboflavin synthase